jgi:hypothetical protein
LVGFLEDGGDIELFENGKETTGVEIIGDSSSVVD